MSRVVKIGWFIGGLLIVLLSYFSLQHKDETPPIQSLSLEPFAQEIAPEAELIFNQISSTNSKSYTDSIGQLIRDEKWYYLSYKNKRLNHWNSNKILIDPTVLNNRSFPIRYTFGDDIYVVFKSESSFLGYRIVNGNKVNSRLVKFDKAFQNKLILADNIPIMDNKISLKTQHRDAYKGTFLVISLFTSFLFLILFLFHAKREQNLMHLATLIVVGINLLVFYNLKISYHDYFFLSNQNFNTLSNEHLLTILFIHLISIILISVSLIYIFRKYKRPLTGSIIIGVLVFSLDFFIHLSINIITHINILLDFERLIEFDISSYLLLSYICLSFILFWVTCYFSKSKLKLRNINHWISYLIGVSIFIGFQYVNADRIPINLISISLLLGLCLLINSYVQSIKKLVYVYSFLTAAIISGVIYYSQTARTENYLLEYAAKIMDNKDEQTINRLARIENQLALEFLTPENYEDFNNRKDVIEGRIKQLYFSNYLEKYELKLFSFGADGININQNNLYTIYYLDSLYNSQTKRTTSAYFYELDQSSTNNGYIAKFENCDIKGHFGTTFILLEPRIIQSDFLYPESFANQKDKEIISLDNYSYGIYVSEKLISQLGEFPYQLQTIPVNNNANLFFGGIKHTRYSNNNYDVILSVYANPFRQILTIFTFILIIIIFIGMIGSLVLKVFSITNQQVTMIFLPDLSHHLSSRIQVAITGILIFGLLLSVYTIVQFEKSNYNAMLEEQLLNKVKNISSRLQNRVNLSKKLSNEEERLLILNEESNTHQVDINLFDKNGKLLGSSKPYIIDNEILGSQMNPLAYSKLSFDKTSQLLIQEELEGSDYLSAYVPLFNGKNEVIGYVNTPLFSKNELLNKQLSDLIINIINVYFLLLIVSGFIAYFISKEISKPLESIREKIAKTVLRGSNELINYNRDDEIGQLVKQYNKMATELQESAQQIASSEREGAWKEMAKQVAHEIKNPLTPMKLSIQHLQRSIKNDTPEKQRRLTQKTSTLLLKQIESLSIMAEQFSSFAQMPQDQFEVLNLSDITQEIVSLFKQDKNIQVESEIQENVFLWADREQIKRVLINIVKNATQAIPEDVTGKIKISLKAKTEIQIEISDNGIGIAPDNYQNIFTPNFSTKNSGMGLGLALSKKIIEISGGQIQFKSTVNTGTTFYISLPVYKHEKY